jgi:hypothetical protein
VLLRSSSGFKARGSRSKQQPIVPVADCWDQAIAKAEA